MMAIFERVNEIGEKEGEKKKKSALGDLKSLSTLKVRK